MNNRILTATGYQEAIRGLLGVSAQILSDTAIGQENIIALAESKIIKQVPNYAAILADTNNPDDAIYLRSAVTAQVAANCCPGLEAKFKTSERSETGYQYNKESVDWIKKKVELETEAKGYLSMISSIEIKYQSPSMAGLTGATRTADNAQ